MAQQASAMGSAPRADLSWVRVLHLPPSAGSADSRDSPTEAQASRPALLVLFQRKQSHGQLIHAAYRQYGYRLAEIADYLNVHYATVSRRLRQAEQANA